MDCIKLVQREVKRLIFQYWGGIKYCNICSITFHTISCKNYFFWYCILHVPICIECGKQCVKGSKLCLVCTYIEEMASEEMSFDSERSFHLEFRPGDTLFSW